MATYDTPFHAYVEWHDGTSWHFDGIDDPVLPLAHSAQSTGFDTTVDLYFDIPAIGSFTNLAVAVWLEHEDVRFVQVLAVDPNFDEAYAFDLVGAPPDAGADLGTSGADAIFDVDGPAPSYGTYDGTAFEWTGLTAAPPMTGRWRAADVEKNPSGNYQTFVLTGASMPASNTTPGGEAPAIDNCWAVEFRFASKEVSPGVFEVPAFTIQRAALIVNEPYDYGGGDPDADTLDTSTGGTGGGVGGTGKPGLGVGSGGVGPTATGASAPPTGGTGGGSAGGVVYPAAGGLPASRDVDGLVFFVTGMHKPDGTAAPMIGRIVDFTDGQVEIPSYNDARTAQVTIKTNEPVAETVRGRQHMLLAFFRGVPVFWGTIVTRHINFGEGTITLAARDPSLRLEQHFIRAHDLDDTVTDVEGKTFPLAVDGTGMRLLRDTANNTTGQDTAGYPVLGIGDGDLYTPDTAALMEVRRGDPVWEQMQTLASHTIGPDFRLRPTTTTDGAYVLLDTYERMGADRSTIVTFDYGWRLDNAENVEYEEGAKLITHAHSLDRDLRYRFTEANTTAAALYGVYVEWDATDYDTETLTEAEAEAVLRAHARGIIAAYSHPLETFTITPRPGAAARFLYLRDFGDGDTISFAAKRDLVTAYGTARITKVTLSDPGSQIVSQQLEVVSSFAPDAELGGSEDA